MTRFDAPALIDACYAAALDPALWPAALDGIAQAVGGRGGLIVSHDPRRTPLTLHSESLDAVDRDYGARGWWQFDTRIARANALGLAAGSVVCDEMYFPADAKRHDPFIQDFFRGHGLDNLAGCLDTDPIDGTGLSFSAPRDAARGVFEGFELDRMRLLGPHATRAFKLTTILGEARRGAGDLGTALDRMRAGIVALDRAGCVRSVNAAAERLVAGYLVLRTGRTPEAAEPADRDRLGRFLAEYLPGPGVPRKTSILLRRKGGGRPLFVEALPLPGGASDCAWTSTWTGNGVNGLILLVRDLLAPSARAIEPLLEPLGLTAAEARVAALVGRGASPREAAGTLAVGESTVRTQLKAIYAKLGIRRQSELAVLVTRLDGV
ncbi:LuxR family transcriptional regulator [Methylobacterium sp. Leaf456]|uniref:helix-turn-helix transcriptional regulator n=1 Tax=Methylobacterium sp. Leaf456 TaxID=1736382 RepID=UPI0006F6A6F7|nr:helix-turn-helix transcriptional regulator [Methylobacterium sp. Leaf456]KQT50509.1 LuxR family transcriptional regulator [Methylobacterium sp. Leaf456]